MEVQFRIISDERNSSSPQVIPAQVTLHKVTAFQGMLPRMNEKALISHSFPPGVCQPRRGQFPSLQGQLQESAT